MSRFNPKASRSKRPCPIWVDAFQRDTQHLEADEVGAYFLILMAMWTRESCDFPDDDSRLARVSRVSTRLWKSRIGPALRPFFQTANGALISKRLREEARYVERQVTQQHDRKTGENLANSLESNDPPSSADEPRSEPRDNPSQQPNISGGGGGSASADQTFLERVCIAAGRPIGSLTASGKTYLPGESAGALIRQWVDDLGLTEDQIVAEVERQTRLKRDGPPNGLPYFTEPLRRLAGELNSRPKLTPIEGGQDVQSPRSHRQAASEDRLGRILDAAVRNRAPSR